MNDILILITQFRQKSINLEGKPFGNNKVRFEA